jgi:anthranilate phosphoribosyltransferase
MTPYIMKIGRGKQLAKDLTEEEAYQAFGAIFQGTCSEFQIGAFFAAMRVKGESPEEIAGFIRAAREHACQIHPRVDCLLDFGDPYDGKVKTVNLNPVTAIVLAAAGLPCVLHGAPDIPAKRGIGAGQVLTELGVSIDLSPEQAARGIEEFGMGYLDARRWVPRFEQLTPLRHQYGLRSSINVVEKIWNLANASVLIVGIYHAPYFKSMGGALLWMKNQKSYVVQGVEGFGELTLRRPSKYLEISGGEVQEKMMDAAAFGLRRTENWDLDRGSVARHHAEANRRVLEGEGSLLRKAVIFNAGVKLFWSNKASSVEEGIERARDTIDSRRALAQLAAFRKYCEDQPRGSFSFAETKGK